MRQCQFDSLNARVYDQAIFWVKTKSGILKVNFYINFWFHGRLRFHWVTQMKGVGIVYLAAKMSKRLWFSLTCKWTGNQCPSNKVTYLLSNHLNNIFFTRNSSMRFDWVAPGTTLNVYLFCYLAKIEINNGYNRLSIHLFSISFVEYLLFASESTRWLFAPWAWGEWKGECHTVLDHSVRCSPW